MSSVWDCQQKFGPATTPPHGITGTDVRQGLVLGEKSWF